MLTFLRFLGKFLTVRVFFFHGNQEATIVVFLKNLLSDFCIQGAAEPGVNMVGLL